MSTLDAIRRQRFDLASVEVVVVADGCHDDTAAAARSYDAPFTIRVIELPGVGPAGARNRGSEAAGAPLLVFLDDDVEPLETWLAAHAEVHARVPGALGIGAYPPVRQRGGEFRRGMRRWWTQHFNQLEQPGHRFTFQDVLTGNLSISRNLWNALGGMDEKFPRAREDWELGVRAIAAGATLVYAPRAFAWHHEYETTDLQGMLRRATEEGRSDVRMGIKHPEIKAKLPIHNYWWTKGTHRWLAFRMFRASRFERQLKRLSAKLSANFGQWNSGPLFTQSFELTRFMHYMEGAIEELRDIKTWKAFAIENAEKPRTSLTLDLRNSLEQAEEILDTTRPDQVHVFYGPIEVGFLPFVPGAEPWAARHLKSQLTEQLGGSLLSALELSGELAEGNWGADRNLTMGVTAKAFTGLKGVDFH
jgi:GT2 family glycosyltransferase